MSSESLKRKKKKHNNESLEELPMATKNLTVSSEEPQNQTKKRKSKTDMLKVEESCEKIGEEVTTGPTGVQILKTPIKSENDKKSYRVVRLENGLTACLISDLKNSTTSDGVNGTNESNDDVSGNESDSDNDDDDIERKKNKQTDEKLAALGLCVSVGSFSDPKEIQGLAHFLEHMVFMGNEKYPEENDFDSFLSKRGGSDNATTDVETTTFYVECQDRHLPEVLDRFSQFFICPLLKPDAVTREREAIESEFQMALQSDSDRREQLLFSFAPADNPANTFTWGNSVTLHENIEQKKLLKSLRNFRRRHYSANRMCLAIQAQLSLDTLQEYVVDYFSPVFTNRLPPLDLAPFGQGVFDTSEFKKMYYVKPVKDTCQVYLTWPLHSLLTFYKSKPHYYLGWILGHEGKGSLIAYLKKKVWALGITAGNSETGFEHNSIYSLFIICLTLTREGLDNIEHVLNSVFSYIQLLKKVGPQERIFKEIQTIDETSFRFEPERKAVEIVEDLAEAMHFYPPEHYLCGSELCFEYDPQAITDVLNCLRPDTVNIMIYSSQISDEIKYDQEERWFKTPYTSKEIPREWKKKWKHIEVYDEFVLPAPNMFLTRNFEILSHDDVPDYPKKILHSPLMELWYRSDVKFRLPTAYMYFYFITPLSLATPHSAAMVDLYATLLQLQLNDELYPAQVAGLHYAISASEKGIMLKVDGYNEKLTLLLELILQYMRNFAQNLTKEFFEVVKEKQTRYYHNVFIKPSTLARDVRLSILVQGHWTSLDKHAAIKSITYPMMQLFGYEFLNQLYIQSLIQGNISYKSALIVGQLIESELQASPLLPNTFPEFRVRQLPIGEYCCRIKSFNQNDQNSIITNYYQSGAANVQNLVLVELIMMIIEEPLFDMLRTKEQLGYHIFCSLRDTFGILGYSITVNTQADKYSANYVDKRIEAFTKHARKLIKKMPIDEFDEIKNDLIKLKMCADVHLHEEVSRNWAEITSHEYLFDRLKREVKYIKKIQKDDILQWLNAHISSSNRSNFRKISIQIVGHGDENHEVQTKDSKDSDCSIKKSKKFVHKTIYYGAPVQYPLNLINIDNSNEDASEIEVITDIEDFKNSLYIYPIQRRKCIDKLNNVQI